MDLFLSGEHQVIRETAREFAEREIVPIAAAHDATGEFSRATVAKMGQQGFMGVEVPERYGGGGLDALAYVLMIEELSKADASHGVIALVSNSLLCHAILQHGTEEQKLTYLAPVASGTVFGAYAITERQSGSDASNIRTTAKRTPDGTAYVLNGTKSWVTSGPVARFVVLFAQTGPRLNRATAASALSS